MSAVSETEHHEIAVYEGLITNATAMNAEDLVVLLEENLADEKSALRKAAEIARQLALAVPHAS